MQKRKYSPSFMRPTGARWVPAASHPSHWQAGARDFTSASFSGRMRSFSKYFGYGFICLRYGRIACAKQELTFFGNTPYREQITGSCMEAALSWHAATSVPYMGRGDTHVDTNEH